MISMPLVSIIVPTYNHSKYIDDLFCSLINQTYSNIEIIIQDDCSKDDTYSKIEKFKSLYSYKFKRIYIERNENNIGLPCNLNKALHYVNGKYIKIIASDDMLMPECIEKFVQYYEIHQEYTFLLSNAYIISDNSKYNDIPNFSKLAYKIMPVYNETFFDKLLIYNFIIAPAVFLKTSEIIKVGKFDERFKIEDHIVWLRLARMGKVGIINDVLVCYRYTIKDKLRTSFDTSNSPEYYLEILNENLKFVKTKKMRKNALGKNLSIPLLYAIKYNDKKIFVSIKELINNSFIMYLLVIFYIVRIYLSQVKRFLVSRVYNGV